MHSVDLSRSQPLKRARLDDGHSDREESVGPSMHVDSAAKTNASDKASEADIKYVNTIYNTKAA